MKIYFLKILSALLLLLSAGVRPAAAAQRSKADEPPRIDRAVFSTNSQNSGAILQDRDGFIWIGTLGAGLLRFDGYELKAYKPGGLNPFPDSYVYALYEDGDGVIWIGTGTSGLVRYDKNTDTFKQYTHDPQNPRSISSNVGSLFARQTICEDADGLLWVGRQDGLNAFDKRTETFTRYLHDPQNPNSLGRNDIYSILVDRQGLIWVGTNGGGLDRLDKNTGVFTHFVSDPAEVQSLTSNMITALLEDEAGTLWVGTNHGFNRYNPGDNSFTRYLAASADDSTPPKNFVFSLYQDSQRNIWITYRRNPERGLSTFDKNTGAFKHYASDPANPSSLSTNAINSVMEDRAGILWFVNDMSVVDKLDKNASRFKLYLNNPTNPNSLPADMVVKIYQDSRQTLWIATYPTGLTAYNKNTRVFTRYLSQTYSPGIYEDSAGNLWLGTVLPGALCLFDRETGQIIKSFTNDPANPNSMAANMQVNAIVEDKFNPDLLWVVTMGAGVEQFNKRTETFTHYAHDPANPDTVSNNSLWMLYRDRDGNLWLPTVGGGLDSLDPRTGHFTYYTHDPDDPASLSSDSVNVVFEDSAGRLWVGTSLGLDRLDRATGKFTHYPQATSYSMTMIQSIIEDDVGNLWVGSQSGDGLAKFDPRTGIMQVYHASDGLQGDVFFQGAVKDHEGELWFGGIKGMNSFYSNEVGINRYIPPVKVTALKQGGEPMRLGQAPERVSALHFGWQQNYFEFEYTALNFTNPAKNQYKYRLEGLDKDWFDAGTRRFGRYSGLRGGDYTLRIIASNNDGIWNETGVAIKVTVETPFWESWWFYPLVGVLLCGVSLLAYLYRTRQVRAIRVVAHSLRESEERYRQLNVILEQRVQERTTQWDAANQELRATNAELLATNQDLRATNQELEAFDYSVSHDLRAPLRHLYSFSQILLEEYSAQVSDEGQRLLQRIHAGAQRMDELIEGLLRLSRLTRGELRRAEIDLSALVWLIVDGLRQQEPERTVEFVIAEGVSAYADPRLMSVALENLLNNAWKFTCRQEKACIEFGVMPVENGPPAYFVRDNGAGFDMTYASRLFMAFQRLHEAEEFPGHGIGLATVQRIIQRHGGRVWADGKVNEGATFYFTLGTKPLL